MSRPSGFRDRGAAGYFLKGWYCNWHMAAGLRRREALREGSSGCDHPPSRPSRPPPMTPRKEEERAGPCDVTAV